MEKEVKSKEYTIKAVSEEPDENDYVDAEAKSIQRLIEKTGAKSSDQFSAS